MSNPNTAIAPGTANGQASLSFTRDSANSGFRFQTADALPVLPLPPDFSSYGFNKSRITFSTKDTVFIPAVDTIINDYAAQRLQAIFTIKFVELINQQFFLFDYSMENDKLEYAVNFYFRICNLPMVSSADVRKTLAFYLDASSALASGGDANYMDKFNRAYQIISSRSAK